jgi:hypothetical protein
MKCGQVCNSCQTRLLLNTYKTHASYDPPNTCASQYVKSLKLGPLCTTRKVKRQPGETGLTSLFLPKCSNTKSRHHQHHHGVHEGLGVFILFLAPLNEVGPSMSSSVALRFFVPLVYIVVLVLVFCLCPSSVRVVATFPRLTLRRAGNLSRGHHNTHKILKRKKH